MKNPESEHVARFLAVQVGEGCRAGFPAESVVEVMRPLPVEAVAGMPRFVMGIAIIRASPIPVIDLAVILGVNRAAEASRFVVLRAGDRNIAAAVEGVFGIVNVRRASLDAVPALLRDAPGEFLQALSSLDQQLLLILSASRLVPDSVFEVVSTSMGGV